MRRRNSAKRLVEASWMVSFGDLLALMLTFFALMFAMRTVPDEEWRVLVDALRSELDRPLVPAQAAPPVPDVVPTPVLSAPEAGLSLDYLKALIRDVDLETDPAAEGVRIDRSAGRLSISAPLSLMFEPGSALMRFPARAFLDRMAKRLVLLPNDVRVRVVSESRLSGGDYGGIWELSLAQGAAVADALRAGGYVDPISQVAAMDLPLPADAGVLPLDRQLERRRRLELTVLTYDREAGDAAGR